MVVVLVAVFIKFYCSMPIGINAVLPNCSGSHMNRQQVIEMARNLHVNEKYLYKSSLKHLIWKIQEAQGRIPCYLMDERFTCQADCEWSGSCKKLTAAWLR